MSVNILKTIDDRKQLISLEDYSFIYERKIIVDGGIERKAARKIREQILYLARTEGDIQLWIDSPGGEVNAGLSIVDIMNGVENDIVTVCVGEASSMAAVLLACGTKGKRYALPHAEVMIHQPIGGGCRGQASDLVIHTNRILKKKAELNELLAGATGKSETEIQEICDRDHFFSAREAVSYGLVDLIGFPE